MTTPSAKVEEYLETIYNMEMEGETVIGARLAEKFQVKAPTVTEMVQRLEKFGYVTVNSHRHILLTEEGVQLAESVLRRHRLTERFLTDMLGMQWHEVHEEACRLEHYISGAVEERVIASLGHPTTCPHGNPIPGYVDDARGYLARVGARRLTETTGEAVRILCVSEVIEDEEETIRAMHDRGLMPGTVITWQPADADEGTVTLAQGQVEKIPLKLARALWVLPAEAPMPVGAAGATQQ
jgi:DtxR family Mn-dependent transcriptional regulator